MRIFDRERVTLFIGPEHSGKIMQPLAIREEDEHCALFNWQELNLQIATVQHVQLPNVEKGGEFLLVNRFY